MRTSSISQGSTSAVRAAIALLALAIGITACNSHVTSPSGSAEFSQTDLVVGTGAPAVSGSVVTVHYTGWLYDESKEDNKGLQFDTSADSAGFAFSLGAGQVIAGWDEGIPGMRVGGTRRLIVPPSFAYGNSRNSSIPPNATLVFDVQLLSVQ